MGQKYEMIKTNFSLLKATFKHIFSYLGLQFGKLFFLLKKEMSYVLDVMAKYLTLKNS